MPQILNERLLLPVRHCADIMSVIDDLRLLDVGQPLARMGLYREAQAER